MKCSRFIALILGAVMACAVQAAPLSNVDQLAYIAQDKNQSVEARVDALNQLANYPSTNGLISLARALKDTNYHVRVAAIHASAPFDFKHRWRLLEPLFNDMVVDVRLAVVENLAVDYREMNSMQQQTFGPVLDDYIEAMNLENDQDSIMRLALVKQQVELYYESRSLYKYALSQDPNNVDAILGLVENNRLIKKDVKSLSLLDKSLKTMPDQPELLYAKAMVQVRLNDKTMAADSMNKAAEKAVDNSYYWYLNGILQEPIDENLALKSLQRSYQISARPEHLYAVCDFKLRHYHPDSKQCIAKLERVAPPHVTKELKTRAL
ncbi:probable deca-heme c-type cytochrome [Vibrio sp. JCM 19236]|nr:probable deca-heme c-type cytochrome [Vibrio sp. JCM 19236]